METKKENQINDNLELSDEELALITGSADFDKEGEDHNDLKNCVGLSETACLANKECKWKSSFMQKDHCIET